MEFYTKFKRPEKRYEVNSGEKLVETAGYIPARIQIEEFIAAGKRLNAARAEQYDFSGTQKDDETDMLDPTRSPNFDLADGSAYKSEVRRRLNENRKNPETKEDPEDVEEKDEGEA